MSARCTLIAAPITYPCCRWWGPPRLRALPGSQLTPPCASVCRYNDQNKRSIANQYHEVMASATNKYLGGFSRVVVIIALVSGSTAEQVRERPAAPGLLRTAGQADNATAASFRA